MATTVHIPDDLLRVVDERARMHRISRSRFVVRALERAIEEETSWSDEFLETLSDIDDELRDAVDELLAEVAARRGSKDPVEL
jgi:metal-responsive CopG/Arc/MetJ family transcriptional regulator